MTNFYFNSYVTSTSGNAFLSLTPPLSTYKKETMAKAAKIS